MEPQTTPPPIAAFSTPPVRFTLSTAGPAFCPCCGYGLIPNAIVLLAFGHTHEHGQYDIAGVCARCYQQRLYEAIEACFILARPLLNEHCHRTYGVIFLTPNIPALDGHTAIDIHDHLDRGSPLHQRLMYEPPPPPADPDAGQGRLDYDPPPVQDEPPDYDPPCPADLPADHCVRENQLAPNDPP